MTPANAAEEVMKLLQEKKMSNTEPQDDKKMWERELRHMTKKEKKARAIQDFENGKSAKEVAEKYQMNPQWAYNIKYAMKKEDEVRTEEPKVLTAEEKEAAPEPVAIAEKAEEVRMEAPEAHYWEDAVAKRFKRKADNRKEAIRTLHGILRDKNDRIQHLEQELTTMKAEKEETPVVISEPPTAADVTDVPTEGSAVHSPSHYTMGGVEVIDIIKVAVKDADGYEGFCQANILKYMLRYRYKDGVQDLEKAHKYLGYLLEHLKGEGQ